MKMQYKQLNDYRGFIITKSYYTDEKGRVIKSTIVYDAVTYDDGLLDAKKNLADLKKVIDNYLK